MIIIEHATTARARMPRRCRRAAHRSRSRRRRCRHHPRTLGATGARGREDLQGSRRRRACGETYYRSRRRCPILDHDARRIPTGATTASAHRTPRTPKIPFSPPSSRRIGLFGPRTNRTVLKLRLRTLRCPRTLVKIAGARSSFLRRSASYFGNCVTRSSPGTVSFNSLGSVCCFADHRRVGNHCSSLLCRQQKCIPL